MSLKHGADGGVFFTLLRENLQRRSTYSKSAVYGINADTETQEDDEAKKALRLKEMFQKRLRPASSNDLQAALKRAMIKKFLHERINKKFSDALIVSVDG